MLDPGKLEYIYRNNFTMVQKYGWSISSLEGCAPYEREIYLELLKEHLEKKEKEGN